MRVTLLDYGAGNLHSLAKAIAEAGGTVAVETEPRRALETDVLVLPGVGAFASAAAHLAPDRDAFRSAIAGGLPTLGICLGMQLLFESSEEGPGDGLAVIPGMVRRLRASRVPHMGWNDVSDSLDIRSAYFANSYVCQPRDASCVVSWTEQDGERFPAAVRVGRTFGVQYHPEKSSRAGVRVIARFLAEVDA